MRRLLLATVGLLALCAFPAAGTIEASATTVPSSAAPTPSGIGIRLLDIPVATEKDPRAREYIVDNLAPGTTIQRRILVQNNTDQPQNIHIYSAAARISGDSFAGEKAATQNELSGWISADQTRLALAPHTSADDLVTIAVPANAAEGERYAAVWAEIRSTQPDASGSQVTSVSRVGIRVYLSVAPGNGPPSDFTITALTATIKPDGTPEIIAAVQNTGGRAIDLSGTLSLANGPSSLSAGPFVTSRITTLTPGSHGNITIPLRTGLPRGRWDATVHLSSGLLMHTTTATVTFMPTSAEVAVPKPGLSLALWILLGIIAILIIAATMAIILKRRRRQST